jgi:hypothetical protein
VLIVSHWRMNHGPENIYSARWCHFCGSSVAPPVASLTGVASYDRRLDGADVGKLDCIRRSGRLELLRIKTPHAASLNTRKLPCSVALKIGGKCLCWVKRVTSVRSRRLRNVCYASNTDRIDASQQNVARCHKLTFHADFHSWSVVVGSEQFTRARARRLARSPRQACRAAEP